MYKKRILGAISVLAKNSNHNSDFDGPRMVDGVLTASDKSLKYYVRSFLSDRNEDVFYRKSLNDDGSAKLLKERAKDLDIKEKKDFFKCIDNKMFGFTLLFGDKEADKKLNCTLTGPMQIGYGENISDNNDYSNHTITSQFRSNEKGSQTTIGNEHKVNKANYVHYLRFNPETLYKDENLKTKYFKDTTVSIEESDVEKMKHAFSHCIGSSLNGSYNSASKSGTKIGLTVFVTLKEDCDANICIDNTIYCDDYNVYDLSKLIEEVEENRDSIDQVDISYHKNISEIKDIEKLENDNLFSIHKRGYVIV